MPGPEGGPLGGPGPNLSVMDIPEGGPVGGPDGAPGLDCGGIPPIEDETGGIPGVVGGGPAIPPGRLPGGPDNPPVGGAPP